jgi:hypothetical protein
MAHDSAVKQKLKGKAQKAIGEYQQQTGQGVKGGITKAKGELNEKIADARKKMGKGKAEAQEGFDDDL